VALPLLIAVGVMDTPETGSVKVWPTARAGSFHEVVAGVISSRLLVSGLDSEPR
jgi:hypothetical protein